MKSFCLRMMILGAAIVLWSAPNVVRAENMSAVKARMTARLSRLDVLKTSGAIGENNRGMVESREGEGESVVAAENKDRAQVYAAVAKEAWTNADQVGRAQAKQIAQASARGVWLQHVNGSWYKK